MENLKSKKGFSLVELLVVITIIAILSVVAYTAVGGQTIKAKDSKRKQDLNTMQSALEIYFIEKSKYPGVESHSYKANSLSLSYEKLKSTDVPKKFLSQIPTDPRKATDRSGTPKDQPMAYSYKYDIATKKYQIAATLEDENGQMTSYVIGNSDKDLIGGVTIDGATCTTALVKLKHGSTTCFPYIFE